MIAAALFGGNWMVRWMPLTIHPKISLVGDQVPSARSFLWEIAGPIVLPVREGPGNTFSIEWSRCLVTWRRWEAFVDCVAAMKSSMYTSRSVVGWRRGGAVVGMSVQFMFIMVCSIG